MLDEQLSAALSRCPDATICNWCAYCPKDPGAPCPVKLIDFLDALHEEYEKEFLTDPF